MRSTRLWMPICLFLACLVLPVVAATTLQFVVEPGTTVVQIEGQSVRIETTAAVVVSLTSVDGEIAGSVQPAPGVRASDVTITVLGPPDEIIFRGRVSAPVYFEELIPTETGRGEQ